jgi:DNA polymerase bacteriophage-type
LASSLQKPIWSTMMPRYVDLDFETASAADLKLVGASAYAEDPTTEVLCLLYAIGDMKPMRWLPGYDTLALRITASDPDTIFVAHNAGFEQAIWHYIMVPTFGFPEIPIERWEDTMAMAAWKAYPLKLEKTAQAARLPIEKDMVGNRLTLSMSRLDKKTGMYPPRTPEVLARIADYCAQDVAVESALRHKIGLLSNQSPYERGVWCLDQRINQRGVRIDLNFVRQAQRVIDRATVPLLAEFRDLTSGVNPGQVAKVIEWAGTQGVELDNLQKGYLAELLDTEEDADDAGYESLAGEGPVLHSSEMSVSVRRMLEIRSMLGSASIKKLKRMQACVGSDGRARGLLQYHAAGPGRWGGRLLQPQNFPRGSLKVSPEEAVEAIMTGDPDYVENLLGAPAIECVASSLRHALVPNPGNIFLVGDFAGIEARIVLALAGQHDKTAMMAAGVDVYFDMAEAIDGHPKGYFIAAAGGDYELAKKMFLVPRQNGKNTVLGCGFQMGPAKFHDRYCPKQPIEFAEQVVTAYRKQWAPKVPELWYALERAALRAMQTGEPAEAYGVVYRRMNDFLVADLPSGWQRLHYPWPELFHDEQFEKVAWRYSAYKGGKHTKVKAYGGLLTENVVQALARGQLVASMMRLERAGMPIVLTVHDECVCEIRESESDLAKFKALMREPAPWMARIGAPIEVEEWSGKRYRK